MNIPNLQRLADDLRAKPRDQFHLGFWFGRGDMGVVTGSVIPSCQTCACIAGDALMLFAPDVPVMIEHVRMEAREILGLTMRQANELFDPTKIYSPEYAKPYHLPCGRSHGDITPQEAAKVIDHLIATGEVDWRVLN